MVRKLVGGVFIVFALTAGMSAQAVLLNYEFRGTTTDTGSLMFLGGPLINLSNTTFTIRGSTTLDTDLFAVGGVGIFPATSVFDFGALGSFVADSVSGNRYLQNCGIPGVAINCAGLIDSIGGFFRVGFAAVPGDADAGGIPVGMNLLPTATSIGNPFRLANSSSDLLRLEIASIDQFSITAVPAPGSLLLMFLGMAGLAGFVRNKQASTQGRLHSGD